MALAPCAASHFELAAPSLRGGLHMPWASLGTVPTPHLCPPSLSVLSSDPQLQGFVSLVFKGALAVVVYFRV